MKRIAAVAAAAVVIVIVIAITGKLTGKYSISGFLKNLRTDTVQTQEAGENTGTEEEADAGGEGSEEKMDGESSGENAKDDNGEITAEEKLKQQEEQAIDSMLSDMSLHEKVCQLFIVTPESLTGMGQVVAAGNTTKNALQNYPVGGLIYFSANLESVSQTKAMLANTTAMQKDLQMIPLFYGIDEEGGKVARAASKLGTTVFEPMYSYKDQGGDVALQNARTIASDIAGLGFNLDFAPVADTWSNPDNTVIGTRAYSDDFTETAALVAAAVEGFHEGGVACSLKHFPGHGDTSQDSHTEEATSNKTIDELIQNEYLAFESGITAGADMVMVGHITMTNIDGIPASISPVMITDELRGRLGYDGVVITDSLAMGAVANNYSSAELAVKVLNAGADILLMPADFQAAEAGVEAAVSNGTISEERINESVRRILRLKYEREMITGN